MELLRTSLSTKECERNYAFDVFFLLLFFGWKEQNHAKPIVVDENKNK